MDVSHETILRRGHAAETICDGDWRGGVRGVGEGGGGDSHVRVRSTSVGHRGRSLRRHCTKADRGAGFASVAIRIAPGGDDVPLGWGRVERRRRGEGAGPV